ncbi:MAG TPA: sulfite oxidase-like oxidoreductase [Gemmatimonadales bacterium]|nr:sulfite oxidase-like oxidoreductase [Gemmatimonadales bacterium]
MNRLPPGQVETRKWPVLHSSHVPMVDPATWRFTVTGLVKHPLTLSWSELDEFPRQETLCDIHCVTHWSRFDTRFAGIPVRAILAAARPLPAAGYVMVHADPDYSTNLPLGDLDREENLLATHYAGEPLTPEHGGPIRLLVPHLYLWKSAKWVTGFEFMELDEPGYWERNGYHMRGDPWSEQRYGRPDPARMRRGSRGTPGG